jgi:uncharacterized protein (DUF1501 family)
MLDRRGFLKFGAKTGLATAFMPLWMRLAGVEAYAQSASGYKAVVCISLLGGNDGNNMIVPMDTATYNEYANVRKTLALSEGSLLPVKTSAGGLYGFHPSLPNLTSIFSAGNASVIANVGPMDQPVTKQLLQQNPALLPQLFGSHPVGLAQWESATAESAPSSGWGGRIADHISSMSGLLPPVLSLSGVSTFTVGESVQSVSMTQASAGDLPLPPELLDPTITISSLDGQSNNELVQRAAQMRASALQLQTILQQSQKAGSTIKTVFPTSTLGQDLQSIAQVINGRSVTEASRQLFYANVGNYDTHGAQAGTHAELLADLDSSLGAFVTALKEIGMFNDVLILTLSDFGRTMESNSSAGSDHAWGNHQFLIGGGLTGNRVIGQLPDFDIGGSQDYTGQGVWIPTIATQQIAANVATWLGLNTTQVSGIFPNLANFSATPVHF